MPIISKPLLVLGSLAGVSLLGTGGYFGISHLVSSNSQQSTESNSSLVNSGSQMSDLEPNAEVPVVQPQAGTGENSAGKPLLAVADTEGQGISGKQENISGPGQTAQSQDQVKGSDSTNTGDAAGTEESKSNDQISSGAGQ